MNKVYVRNVNDQVPTKQRIMAIPFTNAVTEECERNVLESHDYLTSSPVCYVVQVTSCELNMSAIHLFVLVFQPPTHYNKYCI